MPHPGPGIPRDPLLPARVYIPRQPSLHVRDNTTENPSEGHLPSTNDTITIAVLCTVIPTALIILLVWHLRRRAKKSRARAMSHEAGLGKWDPGMESTPSVHRSWVDVDVEMGRRTEETLRGMKRFEREAEHGVAAAVDEGRGMKRFEREVECGVMDEREHQKAWVERGSRVGRDDAVAGGAHQAYRIPVPPPPVVVGAGAGGECDSYYIHPGGGGYAPMSQRSSRPTLPWGQGPADDPVDEPSCVRMSGSRGLGVRC